jgi:hypothetical protein
MNMVPGRDPALCPVCEEPYAGGCHVCPGPKAAQPGGQEMTPEQGMTPEQQALLAALAGANAAQDDLQPGDVLHLEARGTFAEDSLREWPPGLHEIHCGPLSERDDRCGPRGERCGCPCHRGLPVPPLASGLTGDEAVQALVRLGSSEDLANRAVADAMLDRWSALPRDHAVWQVTTRKMGRQPESTFAIYTKVPVPGRPGHFQAGPPEIYTNIVLRDPEIPARPAPANDWAVTGNVNGFTGLTGNQALETLTGGTFGYTRARAATAIETARQTGDRMGILERHVVYLLDDGFTIEPRRQPAVTLTSPEVPEIPPQVREAFDDALAEAGPGWFALLDRSVQRLLLDIEAVDAHLDDPAGLAPAFAESEVANRMRRVAKPMTEANEAYEEMELFHGSNPRKPQDPEAYDRMLAELGDTAVCALLAIQSQVKNLSLTWKVFLAALAKARSRVPGGAGPALPPESGMDDQAARDNGITG